MPRLTVTKENKAEGVVIKPLNKVLYVETSKGRSRAIVKKKAVQFTEKVLDSSKSRHQQARERNKETHSDDPWIAVEAEITSIENILFPYINEARLFSVVASQKTNLFTLCRYPKKANIYRMKILQNLLYETPSNLLKKKTLA